MNHYRKAGSTIREYKVGKVLGTGGFSITYEAFHAHLDRHFAIKEFFPTGVAQRQKNGNVTAQAESAKKEEFAKGLERFLKEGRTLEAINHPNIVKVRDVFVEGGTGFMVMDFIDGETLETRIMRDGAMLPQSVRPMIDSLCDGLEAVHEAGFLHRDIKPSNIMLRAGDRMPILIDFGAAKNLQGTSGATTQFVSQGYSPIETTATRLESGPWSDIYSLSGTAWFALKGKAPVDAIAERFSAEADPLEPLVKLGGPWMSFLAALDRGLALYPDKRPQSVAAWRAAFDESHTRVVSAEERYRLANASSPTKSEQDWSAASDGSRYNQVEQEAEAGDDTASEFVDHSSARHAAIICAVGVFAFLFANRLAEPAADFPWFYSIAGSLLIAASWSLGLFLFDSLFEKLRHRFQFSSKWIYAAHYLLTPILAMLMLVPVVLATERLPNLDAHLINSTSDFYSGAAVVFAMLWVFVALFAARRLMTLSEGVNASFFAGVFATISLCGFATPFFRLDEDAAMKRLAAIGYFPVVNETSQNGNAVTAHNADVIRSFQSTQNLEETGTITPETWRALLWEPIKWRWYVDPAKPDAALKIVLARNSCSGHCEIEIGPGIVNIANATANYESRFSTTEFTYGGNGLNLVNNGLTIKGAGPDTILANGDVESEANISNLALRDGRLLYAGGLIKDVTVTVNSPRPGVELSEFGLSEKKSSFDNVRVANSAGPALSLSYGGDPAPEEDKWPRIVITNSDFTGGGQNIGAVVSFDGYLDVALESGEIKGGEAGKPAIAFTKAKGGIYRMSGACLTADQKSDIWIRESDLSTCGVSGPVINAKNGAQVDVEATTTLPNRPRSELFVKDASSSVQFE